MADSPMKRNFSFTGAGDLIKILPTGTVFLYQFLSPVLTNSGNCEPFNKVLVLVLVVLCGLFCMLSSFTDSYIDHEGEPKWVFLSFSSKPAGEQAQPQVQENSPVNEKIKTGDVVHAMLSVAVFAVLVVLDLNMVHCFFPNMEKKQKVLVQALPVVVGAVSSAVFVMFPNTRHGIGYHSTATATGVHKATPKT